MFKQKQKKITRAILVGSVALVLIIAAYAANLSEYFKGQLNLHETGEKLFSTKLTAAELPTFKICETRLGKCLTDNTKEATIKFRLPNGSYIDQISLENAEFGAYQLVVDSDQAGAVKLAKKGSDQEVKLGAAKKPYQLSKDDAVYVKDSAGIKIQIPDLPAGQGFDIFNLEYPIKESKEINILTQETKSADGTGELFLAYPEFMESRVNGKKFSSDLMKMADEINGKIAKQLNTNKAEFYLIVTPSVIAPDFYRTTNYTASGMAYPKIFAPDSSGKKIKPKYGINLEKTFPECAKEKEFKDKKCYETPKDMAYLEYLLTHEFGHIYQYTVAKADEKLKGQNVAFLEAGTELNSTFLSAAFGAKAKFLQQVKEKTNCNKLQGDHETGFCIAAFFIDDIDKQATTRFFNFDKTYDFGPTKNSKKYCDTWFEIMEYVTGKNLSAKKPEYQKSICATDF
jgi:hypothetical protein